MADVPQVNPVDVPADAYIIDVREPYEWEGGHAQTAHHIPLGELVERIAEVPKDQEVYFICHGGGRSQRAATYLAESGYTTRNIAGGTSAWFAAQLPMVSENGQDPAVIH